MPVGSAEGPTQILTNIFFYLTSFNTMNIAVILGTVRKGRQSEKVYKVLLGILKQKGIEVTALDLAELDLPRYDGESYSHPGVLKLAEGVKLADGVMIVTPEYNHAIPGVLKDAIDYLGGGVMANKPLASVAVSSGPFGGVRAIKELQLIWLGNKGIALPMFLPTPSVEQFDEQNPPADWLEKADKFVDLSLETLKKFVQ